MTPPVDSGPGAATPVITQQQEGGRTAPPSAHTRCHSAGVPPRSLFRLTIMADLPPSSLGALDALGSTRQMLFCVIGRAANAHVPVGSDLPVVIVGGRNVCGVLS